MTALLAFESEHRGDPVTITPEMISVEGSSMGLRAGEVLALGDIARGMMMASGNDGANAIALYLSDSAEAFSEKMNARAAELHMMQTHFVTPSGLDAEGHGSTAYDMALLAAEAMQNEEFAAAVGQTTLSVPFISPEKTVRYENHNRLLKLYPDCTGIKTGFTKKAGRCLVSSAERDGARLICVTLNAPDDWNDHMNLYDYGFAQLAERTYTADFQPVSLPAVGGEKECISLTLQTQGSAVHPFPVGKGEGIGNRFSRLVVCRDRFPLFFHSFFSPLNNLCRAAAVLQWRKHSMLPVFPIQQRGNSQNVILSQSFYLQPE